MPEDLIIIPGYNFVGKNLCLKFALYNDFNGEIDFTGFELEEFIGVHDEYNPYKVYKISDMDFEKIEELIRILKSFQYKKIFEKTKNIDE